MTKRVTVFLIYISVFLILISPGCKKSPITPQLEDLTRPIIWLNSFEMSFSASEAGGNPAAQTVKIKNCGKNTLNYTISDDVEWLSVTPTTGSSSGQIQEHTISINKAGLAVQDANYSATITITCSEAYNNPQKVTVNLKIAKEPPPEIGVSAGTITFRTTLGQNPSPESLGIRNNGGGTLSYQITWDASWLSVAPANGSSTRGENIHTVSANADSLGVGNYNGTITIAASNAINSPQRISVSLDISNVPTNNEIWISCSPSSGGTGTTVNVPISIQGNVNEISVFGLDLTFDSNLFQYQGTSKGTLTGSWAAVDGNITGTGTLKVGGFKGIGSTITRGSSGTIAIITLRVTGTGYSDGHQSQISISSYADDIAGMKPELSNTTFTYRK